MVDTYFSFVAGYGLFWLISFGFIAVLAAKVEKLEKKQRPDG